MAGKRMVVVKKSNIMLLILIISAAFLFTGIYCVNGRDRSVAAFSHAGYTGKESGGDLTMSMLYPYISQAVEKYYGEPKRLVYDDIIKIEGSGGEEDRLEITVRIATADGGNDFLFGLETVTLVKSAGGLSIKNFRHEDIIPIGRRN